MNKFGFIGCGNMGSAIAKAVAKTENKGILLSNPTKQKTKLLADAIGAEISDNGEIARNCRFIILGVKPQKLCEVMTEIKEELKSRKDRFVLITMAAGVSINVLTEMVGAEYPIIRIMPNTAVEIGEGMTVYCKNSLVSDEENNAFLKAFSKSGLVDEINENLIDAASAVSGCGPAFVYMFASALADGAVRCGLPRKKALMYAAKTLAGAGDMLLASDKHPGELKDAVCSPGGSTIAGVVSLEKSGFEGAAADAVFASFERTKEMAAGK